jgi:mannose-6-phosphate isomerase-like protein (cupin superfamily)
MKIILTCLLFISSLVLTAQSAFMLNNIEAPENFENIYIQKMNEDSLSSAFLIWIKKEVAKHKHLHHTENVFILEGTGVMTLNDSSFHVQTGMHIFIPKNTFHSLKVNSDFPVKAISIQSPKFDPSDRITK